MQTNISFYAISDFVNLTLCILSLYGAYHNFMFHKVSDYGADAILVYLIGLFDSKQAKLIQTDQKLIFRMGLILSLLGIGALIALVF